MLHISESCGLLRLVLIVLMSLTLLEYISISGKYWDSTTNLKAMKHRNNCLQEHNTKIWMIEYLKHIVTELA